MSIYSGFATRQQEETYDNYLLGLIEILQRRLLMFFRNEQADDSKFATTIKKLYGSLRKMEKYKYLDPKMSHSFDEIIAYFGENEQKTNQTKENPTSRSIIQSISNIGATEPVKKMFMTPSNPQPNNVVQSYFRDSIDQKRPTTQSFRIKRPMTTKYSSEKRPQSEEKPQVKVLAPQKDNDDDSIRQVLDQYLNGTQTQKLSKAQRHYMRFFKKHKQQIGQTFKQGLRRK